jgi:hypothetical protein
MKRIPSWVVPFTSYLLLLGIFLVLAGRYPPLTETMAKSLKGKSEVEALVRVFAGIYGMALVALPSIFLGVMVEDLSTRQRIAGTIFCFGVLIFVLWWFYGTPEGWIEFIWRWNEIKMGLALSGLFIAWSIPVWIYFKLFNAMNKRRRIIFAFVLEVWSVGFIAITAMMKFPVQDLLSICLIGWWTAVFLLEITTVRLISPKLKRIWHILLLISLIVSIALAIIIY